MDGVVICSATRSAVGRRGGSLARAHAAELLGSLITSALDRAGVAGEQVDQVFGGCVNQVGMQSFNVTRTAWLTAGLPHGVPSTTVNIQCGSSQQAANLAAQTIAAGAADVTVACGVEVMSRVPISASLGEGMGKSVNRAYFKHRKYLTQFQAAELIAKRWGISREQSDEFAVLSQGRAATAIAEGRFASQITPVAVTTESGSDAIFGTDECPRPTTFAGLSQLAPLAAQSVHTAGTSSGIADGASAMVLARREQAAALGLPVRARVVDTCIVGSDPELTLTGPIEATAKILKRNGLTLDDLDVVENNEAFAAVVLAWLREHPIDIGRFNINGGAIALGHALGNTGVSLVVKALHELERSDGALALVTMCCGGGLATATLLERLA